MSKAEFIAELNDRLTVLTDEERRDILDEYEQHIDIKVMRGMSEEAAIADFGRIDELAADILEAYHVRADYALAEQHGRKKGSAGRLFRQKPALATEGDRADEADGEEREAALGVMGWLNRAYEGTWNGLKHVCGGFWNLCKKAGGGIGRSVRKASNMLVKGTSELIELCKKPFQKGKAIEHENGEAESMNLESANRGKEREKRMKAKSGFSFGRAIGGFFGACVDATLWCIRWMWNLFCIGAGLLFGFGSCIVVFGMGVLIVLLMLGYPLAGITIGWLGLTMCMVSVTVWCFSMVIRGGKKHRQDVTGNGDGMLTEAVDETEDTDVLKAAEEEEGMIHA